MIHKIRKKMKYFHSQFDFNQIIDQEKPVLHLKSILKRGSCTGAYLFTGQEGIGKKTAAICFAKALVCHNPSPYACNACTSCQKIPHTFFSHPDISLYHDVYKPVAISRALLLKKIGFREEEFERVEGIYLEACRLLEEKEFLLNPINYKKGINIIDLFYLDPDIIFVEESGKCYVSAAQIEKNLDSLSKGDSYSYLLAKSLYTFTSGFYKQSFKIGKQENNEGRENIRGIVKEIYLKPSEGRRKVFIIDDAHKMTEEAADAFLKTLEEPPKDSIIILVTSKPEMLLPTIHSRCRKIKFQPVRRKSVSDFIANAKSISQEDAMLTSFLAQGSISKALEMDLEETLKKREEIINLLSSGYLRDIEKFFHFAREFSGEGEKDRKRKTGLTQLFIELMLTLVHDVILAKSGGNVDSILNFDKLAELRGLSRNFEYEQLENIFSILSRTSHLLSRNLDVRITIEALLAEIGGVKGMSKGKAP
ncbi:MAG: hypothetical protein A2149_07945 [Candidatus Schekmanbacteria bacterium RBG_16_38_11]|uniref:DNA-directed DNA polymerase n=1 Tax=Candidatus Schekmanbacteria bacterium RBG_16_38_11 TaxID=1817880 RepID=A0A1F7RWH5_9BACT|nr:MAG: hypothetical protein A2149_07945 [Candidatus Schekmanbacteria bacterium RBG_16_38_11]